MPESRPDRPDDAGSREDEAESILAEILRHPAGEQMQALDDACDAHPGHAHALRDAFALLSGAGLRAEPDPGAFPERLGDFRLVERLGGGGMGVVYLAEQEPLGRLVAIKLIRPEHLYFPEARERFRRETAAIAKLQHPGIVPIYTVGEQGGIPYFAMERIRGCTLAEALRAVAGRAPESLSGADMHRVVAAAANAEPVDEAPVFEGRWIECSLRLVRQAAEALEHAHGRGIVHRDVKPSNIAVTIDGRAVLLDFGLTSSGPAASLTRTGTPVGTLAYMPPEQLRAGHGESDRRADVYSLGVTLYELLTLQPPYFAEEFLATQQLVLEGRPSSMRARNRRVPVDAETVCLKAMDRDRGRRYATAADFARDLANVLEGRTVEARPPTPLLRARRWAGRKPALATALVLGFLLIVGTPAALLIQQQRHAADLELLLEKEKRARAEATQAARTAERSFEFVLGLFAGAHPKVPAASRKVLTARELVDYGAERLEQDLADDPALQARLLVSLGHLYVELKEYRQAIPLLERAVAYYRGSGDPETAPLLVNAITHLGAAHRETGDHQRSEPLLEEALARRRQMHDANHAEVARATSELGVLYTNMDRLDRAESLLRENLRIVSGFPEIRPRALGMAKTNLAQVLMKMKQFAAAEALGVEAVDDLGGSDASDPDLPAVLGNLGLAISYQGRHVDAEPYYRKALVRSRAIYGDGNEWVGIALINLGGLLDRKGDLSGAAEAYREATVVLRKAVGAAHPRTVGAEAGLARELVRLERYAEAEKLLEELVPRLREAYGENNRLLAASLQNLGFCKLGHDDAAAAECFRRSADVFRACRGSDDDAALALGYLGRLRIRGKDYVEAERTLLDALDLSKRSAVGATSRSLLEALVLLYDRWEKPEKAAEYRAQVPESR